MTNDDAVDSRIEGELYELAEAEMDATIGGNPLKELERLPGL